MFDSLCGGLLKVVSHRHMLLDVPGFTTSFQSKGQEIEGWEVGGGRWEAAGGWRDSGEGRGEALDDCPDTTKQMLARHNRRVVMWGETGQGLKPLGGSERRLTLPTSSQSRDGVSAPASSSRGVDFPHFHVLNTLFNLPGEGSWGVGRWSSEPGFRLVDH